MVPQLTTIEPNAGKPTEIVALCKRYPVERGN